MEAAARVTCKGQITIPKIIRDALGVEDGDHVVFRVEGQTCRYCPGARTCWTWPGSSPDRHRHEGHPLGRCRGTAPSASRGHARAQPTISAGVRSSRRGGSRQLMPRSARPGRSAGGGVTSS